MNGALGKIDDDYHYERMFPLALIEQGVDGRRLFDERKDNGTCG